METKIFVGFFKGDPSRKIRIIDTQGFNDPGPSDSLTSSYNQQIITDVMKKLTTIDHVDIFLICLKGNTNRITSSLNYMLTIFRDIFGYKLDNEGKVECDPFVFWNRCVISFSQVPMGHKDVKRRLKNNKQMTDEELAKINIQHLAKYFQIETTQFEHVFIDSYFDKDDDEEEQNFSVSTEKLYRILDTNSLNPAMTSAMLVAYDELGKGKIFYIYL